MSEQALTQKNLELIPLAKWNDFYAYPTVPALRMLVLRQYTNGFSKVIRKIGHRIYIKPSEFFKWVDEQNADRIREY